jgi:hypothetical protein
MNVIARGAFECSDVKAGRAMCDPASMALVWHAGQGGG